MTDSDSSIRVARTSTVDVGRLTTCGSTEFLVCLCGRQPARLSRSAHNQARAAQSPSETSVARAAACGITDMRTDHGFGGALNARNCGNCSSSSACCLASPTSRKSCLPSSFRPLSK